MESEHQSNNLDVLRQAYDSLLVLGELAIRFSEVERAPRYPNGERENDSEHSFMLALCASQIAADYFPDLDSGLVSQFSVVHDLPERYAKDTRTFNITDQQRLEKEVAEKLATDRLISELPAFTANLLFRYEQQKEPEARLVRFVDKLMPSIAIIFAGEALSFRQDYNVHTLEELKVGRQKQVELYNQLFPDFPLLHQLRAMLSDEVERRVFPEAFE